MRAKPTQSGNKSENAQEQPRKLLLFRGDPFPENGPTSALPGAEHLHLSSLLEALGRLESGAIDLVVLGAEFREEERTLFLLDAQRHGFSGPIFHIVSAGSQPSGWKPASESQTKGQMYVLPSFTAKEQAVLHRVAGGWTNLQIARDMQCSVGTVKAILQQLFGKLGVRKRAQIVRLAFERGLPTASSPEARSAEE